MAAHQPADAAAEREATDTGRRNQAAGCREAMRLGLDVDVAPGAAALDDRPATDRVHEHAAHQRQVDDDAAVDAREAGNRMPAAANRDFELLAAGEPQCRR